MSKQPINKTPKEDLVGPDEDRPYEGLMPFSIYRALLESTTSFVIGAVALVVGYIATSYFSVPFSISALGVVASTYLAAINGYVVPLPNTTPGRPKEYNWAMYMAFTVGVLASIVYAFTSGVLMTVTLLIGIWWVNRNFYFALKSDMWNYDVNPPVKSLLAITRVPAMTLAVAVALQIAIPTVALLGVVAISVTVPVIYALYRRQDDATARNFQSSPGEEVEEDYNQLVEYGDRLNDKIDELNEGLSDLDSTDGFGALYGDETYVSSVPNVRGDPRPEEVEELRKELNKASEFLSENHEEKEELRRLVIDIQQMVEEVDTEVYGRNMADEQAL